MLCFMFRYNGLVHLAIEQSASFKMLIIPSGRSLLCRIQLHKSRTYRRWPLNGKAGETPMWTQMHERHLYLV